MKFYTSDLHLGHKNIIEYCNRPFKNVDEMNARLILLWNERVLPTDEVYCVGDFAMGDRSLVPSYLKQLNGYKVLIMGNHDKTGSSMFKGGFNEIYTELTIKEDEKTVYMRHVPNFSAVGKYSVVLGGHVHNAWSYKNGVHNVGVDVSDYRPLTLSEILTRPVMMGKAHREDETEYPSLIQLIERNAKK